MNRQSTSYSPDPQIASIADILARPVEAAGYPETILRFRNDRHAATVGLEGLDDEQWVRHFGRFEPLPDNLPEPLALAYHGHQFRVYNPQIGDGRGFLFAQLRDDKGRLLDLGTKGSGQTPFSRSGDGRLTLKGGVREILATEMLEALGVNTSKTFSLIETGEQLWRGDEPSPTRSAVMVRLSHGHIRIGSFQRLAALQDEEGLKRLIRYALDQYYDGASAEDDALLLLQKVVERTARLAASYMAAGFVHGVLNSDNINVTGESFDYGPWRWTPTWEPGFTAAYFDHAGLYAFGRQAEAIQWDCAQLAGAFRSLCDIDMMMEVLNGFGDIYRAAAAEHFLWRLGFGPRNPEDDLALCGAVEMALGESGVEIDRFFFDWMGRAAGPDEDAYRTGNFDAVREALAGRAVIRERSHDYWSDAAPCSMHIDEMEAIWSHIADNDDWQPLYDKVAAIRRMGEALGPAPG